MRIAKRIRSTTAKVTARLSHSGVGLKRRLKVTRGRECETVTDTTQGVRLAMMKAVANY
ncbi:hypothetical protein [Bosea vaviloviae]|uniref:hypothetical protein n=1 Tax=Bosea vaviloviae TaxID=1526658 RepID=UPI00131431D5|nr:hypothetical protein [Bosea vaviloviae]